MTRKQKGYLFSARAASRHLADNPENARGQADDYRHRLIERLAVETTIL
jgi:hypothetical protein